MTIARMRGAEHNTAAALKSAIARAEAEYAVSEKPPAKGTIKNLRPWEVKMRVELFQPREFSVGIHKVNNAHVKKLADHIETVGELDAVVVIKLGEDWVCVNGHHRVEAYKKLNKKLKGPDTIKCQWFDGTVREAVFASIESNRTLKLEVLKADRLEQAWKHTLLGMGSVRELSYRCAVAPRTIANMRHIKEAVKTRTPKGEALMANLRPKKLLETSWTSVKLAWLDIAPAERDLKKKAATLANYMRMRLQNKLADDPEVTALALAIYDPELPGPLIEALQNPPSTVDEDEIDNPSADEVWAGWVAAEKAPRDDDDDEDDEEEEASAGEETTGTERSHSDPEAP